MKALVVTPTYPVPDNPLAAIFVHRQIASLVRCGVECTVLVFRPAPPPFPRWLVRRSWIRYFARSLSWPKVMDGVRVDVVFYERDWILGEDVVPAIGRALVRHVEAAPELQDVDVVYAHWYWTGGAAALALRDRFGWPVAAIARGSEMHDWHEAHHHCRPYVQRVISEADKLLANCEDLRDRADALSPGSSARMDVIYNGCDAEVFRPAVDREGVRLSLGIGRTERVLLFCGDVCERKGIDELAAAWKMFAARHPEWVLRVIGHVVDHDLGETLRSIGGDRVRLFGRLKPGEVLRWMQAADAYVQPSRLEGLANATMEAMAVGLPVITTDTCGQRELVRNGENGWLIQPGNVPALVSALDALAEDPDGARRLGEEARRTIQTRFDPRAGSARLAVIFQDMAQSRSVVPVDATELHR